MQACNLRCIYCFEAEGSYEQSLNDVSKEKIYNFIKMQAENRRVKNVNLILFGGEPLLNFKNNIDFLDRIQKYCDDSGRGFSTFIVTNGTLITNEIIDWLKKYNCTGIQITLDGTREVHNKRRIYRDGKGSFEEVMRGIETVYKRSDISKPIIRINIDKDNIDETVELIRYLKENKLTDATIDFGIVKTTTEACASYGGECFIEEELGDVLEKLWEELKRNGFTVYEKPIRKNMYCGLYKDASFTVSPNGDVYKCWELVGQPEHKIGVINDEGLVVDTSYAYYEWMTREPAKIKECRECVYLPACGGGCASISYSNEKTYTAKECYKTKGVVEKQVLNFIQNSVK